MSQHVRATIHTEARLHTVSRYLYSQFAEHLGRCIYGGIWVGEDSPFPNTRGIRDDVAGALARLRLPNLRWPGGCFADNYHWMDGLGERAERPRRHNLWWNQPETNQFGTHEFMDLCEMIGAEPYLCLNVGSGTVEEARGWVEYCNSAQNTTLTQIRAEHGRRQPWGVKWWAVGNENWGCGGSMTPEHYANLYRQFGTYVRHMTGPGAKLVACGGNETLPDWNGRLLEGLKGALHLIDYIAMHIYSAQGMPVLDFTEQDYLALLGHVDRMEHHLRSAIGTANAYSVWGQPIGVVIDEWGTWFREATVDNGLYQQSTMQDALFTAASFHMFHRLDGLFMANMAQTVNVLQALVLTKGEQMLLTPTYHVYDMLMPHRDGRLLDSDVQGAARLAVPGRERDAVSLSATAADDGRSVCASLANLSNSEAAQVKLELAGHGPFRVKAARLLGGAALQAHNTFEAPDTVRPVELDAATLNLAALELPAASLLVLELER